MHTWGATGWWTGAGGWARGGVLHFSIIFLARVCVSGTDVDRQ